MKVYYQSSVLLFHYNSAFKLWKMKWFQLSKLATYIMPSYTEVFTLFLDDSGSHCLSNDIRKYWMILKGFCSSSAKLENQMSDIKYVLADQLHLQIAYIIVPMDINKKQFCDWNKLLKQVKPSSSLLCHQTRAGSGKSFSVWRWGHLHLTDDMSGSDRSSPGFCSMEIQAPMPPAVP